MYTGKLALAFMLGFGTLVLFLGMIRGENSLSDYANLVRSEEVLEEVVRNLTIENKELSAEIHNLRASPEYARKVLRDKYHELDEGEKIIFFSDD